MSKEDSTPPSQDETLRPVHHAVHSHSPLASGDTVTPRSAQLLSSEGGIDATRDPGWWIERHEPDADTNTATDDAKVLAPWVAVLR